MRLIEASAEEALIERLQRTGPCCLDDLVIQLPNLSWSCREMLLQEIGRDRHLHLLLILFQDQKRVKSQS